MASPVASACSYVTHRRASIMLSACMRLVSWCRCWSVSVGLRRADRLAGSRAASAARRANATGTLDERRTDPYTGIVTRWSTRTSSLRSFTRVDATTVNSRIRRSRSTFRRSTAGLSDAVLSARTDEHRSGSIEGPIAPPSLRPPARVMGCGASSPLLSGCSVPSDVRPHRRQAMHVHSRASRTSDHTERQVLVDQRAHPTPSQPPESTFTALAAVAAVEESEE
jgi:hypothetical protein